MSPRASLESSADPPIRSLVPSQDRLLNPTFVTLLWVQLSHGFASSLFFLLPKFTVERLHAQADMVGGVAATATITGVLSVPFLGRWIDRGRRRPLITVGACLAGIAALGFPWVESFPLLIYGLRAVQGVAFALVLNAAATMAVDAAPGDRLGRALGVFGAASLAMNALAPTIAEYIASHFGWAPVFGLSAVASLLTMLLSLRIEEPAPSKRWGGGAPWSSIPPARNIVSHFRLPSAVRGRGLVLFTSSVAGAAFGAMFTFTQPFALELGAEKLSSFFLGYTCTAIAVRLLLGDVADRYGRRNVGIFSLVLYGLVVMLTVGLRPTLLPFYGAAFGFTQGLAYPALNALAVDGADARRRGTLVTYFNGAFNAGLAVCVGAAGFLARHAGYASVFLGIGALTVASALALRHTPEERA